MSQLATVGTKVVNVPDEYEPIEPMPFDPPESAAFRREEPGAICYVQAKAIPAEEALSPDVAAIAADVHEHLDDDQGLIEVEVGTSEAGHPYAYKIVRTNFEPSNILYALRLDLSLDGGVASVRANFNTQGSSGYRDSLVLSKIEGTYDGWFFDRYDPGFARGNLMNRSELPEYDADFPDHPLTIARQLAAFLVANN